MEDNNTSIETKELCNEKDFLGRLFIEFNCPSCNLKYRTTEGSGQVLCPECSNE